MSQISVALCTYNGARFVEEQLLSILRQSRAVAQIIVSDDGSNDETVAVVERTFSEWCARHPDHQVAVNILRNSRALGITANFEQALTACTGELIALSDQDDVWAEHRLERMVAEFETRPALLMLHADARLVNADGAPLESTLFETLGISPGELALVHGGRAAEVLMRRNIVTGATVMVRSALVERSRPFPAAWVHDEWMAMVAATTGRVDLIEEPLTDYRQHGGNQIGVTSLDIGGKLGRLRAPRSARNARLLARAEILHERASSFDPLPSLRILNMIDAKLAHEQMRSALPASRFGRVLPLVRSWRAGSYAKFGLGLQDVLRDLVQPV